MSGADLERIGESFFAAEKAEGLVQWRVGNVYFWPVVRSRLLKAMTKNSRMFMAEGERAYVPEHLKTYKGRNAASLLIRRLSLRRYRPLKGEPTFANLRTAKALIVPVYDRGLDGSRDASADVIAKLGQEAFVLGSGIWDEVSPRPHIFDLSDLAWERYGFAARVAARLMVSKNDKALYAKVAKQFQALAPINPYNNFPNWLVSKYLAERRLLAKLFRRMRSLETVYVAGTEAPAIMELARRRGLKLVELEPNKGLTENEDTETLAVFEAAKKIARDLSLATWRSRGISFWEVFQIRLNSVLLGSFRYGKNLAPEAENIARPRTYSGRPPVKLLWAAVNRWPGKTRPGELSFNNLGDLEYIIVPFATRDAEGVDKFSRPVSDLLGDRSLIFGIGQWDRSSERPRIEDLEAFFRRRFALWAKIYARLILKAVDRARYARAARILELSGASLEPFEKFPYQLLEAFLAERRGYARLFRSMPKLKHIYMVNAARMSFIAAAHKRGLKVTEIQSGVFSKYSLQFSWPGSPKVDYIPDEILTWGEYWTAGIERASQQTVRHIGSTEEFESVRDMRIEHKQGHVVFLSQPMVGLSLFAVAVEFAKNRSELNVIFKLHPRNAILEFRQFADTIGGLPKNLQLIQNERSSLEVIAESEVAIGVFSTALVEAAGLETKVAVIKLPGWEHLSPLVAGGHAAAFDGLDDLLAGYDNLPTARHGEYFYGKRSDWREILGVPPAG